MSSLVFDFLGCQITVENDGVRVSGRLIFISKSRGKPDHKPFFLVLKTPCGLCIMRDWKAIFLEGA